MCTRPCTHGAAVQRRRREVPEGAASQHRAPAKGPPAGLTAGGEYMSLSYATSPRSRSVSSTSLHTSTWDPLLSGFKLFWLFLFSPSCCTHVVICRWKGRPSPLPTPLYPGPTSVPALGLWLSVLTSAAFSSLSAHLSCCGFPSPEAAVAETRTRRRKSDRTVAGRATPSRAQNWALV